MVYYIVPFPLLLASGKSIEIDFKIGWLSAIPVDSVVQRI